MFSVTLIADTILYTNPAAFLTNEFPSAAISSGSNLFVQCRRIKLYVEFRDQNSQESSFVERDLEFFWLECSNFESEDPENILI